MLLFLFFITLVSLGHSLNCIHPRTFNMSYVNFNISLFELKIQQLKTFSAEQCRLQVTVDYKEKLILIEFTLTFVASIFLFQVERIDLDTLIRPIKKRDPAVTNSLLFACSSDRCERKFLLKHIRWLIAWKHVSLADNLHSLMHGYSEFDRKYLN